MRADTMRANLPEKPKVEGGGKEREEEKMRRKREENRNEKSPKEGST